MRKSGQLLGSPSPSKDHDQAFLSSCPSLSLSLSLVLRLVVHVDGGVKRKGVGETKEGIMAWDPKGRPCMLALFLSSDL